MLVDFYGCAELISAREDLSRQGIPPWVNTLSGIGGWWDIRRTDRRFGDLHSLFIRKQLSECSPEELDAISPRHYIRKNAEWNDHLDVLICHGDADITVPFAQSVRLAADCTEVFGADRVTFIARDGYAHADDRFYSDDALAELLCEINSRL